MGEIQGTTGAEANYEVFVRGLSYLAKETGKELTNEHFKIYEQACSGLGLHWANRAIEKIILSRKARDPFPQPRELLEAALEMRLGREGMSSAEAIAGSIVGAIRKFGYANPAEAKEHIGEIGWKIILREGGWAHLCQSLREDQVMGLKSQWAKQARDLIETESVRCIEAALKTAPMLGRGQDT